MRIANLSNRLVLVHDSRALDVAVASGGRFSSAPQEVWANWDELVRWAGDQDVVTSGTAFRTADLGPVVPRPAQIFAIGLNYASHARESGFPLPSDPVVFTKFASSLAGADIEIALSGDRVDWEAELVAVIGRGGRDIPVDDGWAHVAGLTVGQDLSDRTVQFWGAPPQFSLGKSFAGFAPVGPELVTVDELTRHHDVEALAVSCTLEREGRDDEVLQAGNTSDLVFDIPTLIARLSAVVELLPGDLIFTGTPAGVGVGREPQQFLRPGDTLRTEIEGIGTLRQRFVAN